MISDRIGLRRSVSFGLILTIIGYGLIPLCNQSLLAALGGVFILFVVFEFAIVSSMSLCTEILPKYRATMMSAFFAAAGAGRVLGALLGGYFWTVGGIWLTGLLSAGITLMAFWSLFLGLKAK